MPTPHNRALLGEFADNILLPGDPLRAKYIAETFFDNAILINDVRNMFAYTGFYQGHAVSVMGTGMGAASMGIYAHELIHHYGVKKLIRIGSMGAIQPFLEIGDIVLALGAGTDTNFANQYGLPGTICALPDSTLMKVCLDLCKAKDIKIHCGQIVSSEIFYHANAEAWKKWAAMNVLGLEMECHALYLTAMHGGAAALTLLTVSDSLLYTTAMTPLQREQSMQNMILLALDTLIKA
jgi:purine-nucleoside phosphorylase